MSMYRYWDGCCNGMGRWNGPWLAFEILGFILLVVVAIVLIRHFMKSSSPPAETPTALDIARARLAKGEITPEEFAAMKDLLK